MSARPSPAIAIALLAGVFGAIQPKINAVLGSRLGSALMASLVNFGVALGFVVLALSLRPGTRRLLAGLRTWEVPWWTLTAGLGGAMVVLAGAVTVETIGVAVFSVAFFAGQIVFGLVVDRLGLAPGGKRQVTAARLQASGLAIIAVVVAQVGRHTGVIAPALVAFVIASGAAVALQSAFNGRIASVTRDPVAATAVNVVVGTTALGAVVALLATTGTLGPLQWPTEPWLYAGGALGVTIVLALAVATAAVGVLSATVAMLAAQMVTAFLVDWTVLRQAPTTGTIIGAVLIIGAVARIGRRPVPAAAPPAGEL